MATTKRTTKKRVQTTKRTVKKAAKKVSKAPAVKRAKKTAKQAASRPDTRKASPPKTTTRRHARVVIRCDRVAEAGSSRGRAAVQALREGR